jgi:hypothetical protein
MYRWSFKEPGSTKWKLLSSWRDDDNITGVEFGSVGNITVGVEARDEVLSVSTSRAVTYVEVKDLATVNTSFLLSKLPNLTANLDNPIETLTQFTQITKALVSMATAKNGQTTAAETAAQNAMVDKVLDSLTQTGVLQNPSSDAIDAATDTISDLLDYTTADASYQSTSAETSGASGTVTTEQAEAQKLAATTRVTEVAAKAANALEKLAAAALNMKEGLTADAASNLVSAVDGIGQLNPTPAPTSSASGPLSLTFPGTRRLSLTSQQKDTEDKLRGAMDNVGAAVAKKAPVGTPVVVKSRKSSMSSTVLKSESSAMMTSNTTVGSFTLPTLPASLLQGVINNGSVVSQLTDWKRNPVSARGYAADSPEVGKQTELNFGNDVCPQIKVDAHVDCCNMEGTEETVQSFTIRIADTSGNAGKELELQFSEDRPVVMDMEVPIAVRNQSDSLLSCQFFNFTSEQWSAQGCRPQNCSDSNIGKTIQKCACTHLSVFGLATGVWAQIFPSQCRPFSFFWNEGLSAENDSWGGRPPAFYIYGLLVVCSIMLAIGFYMDRSLRTVWRDEHFVTHISPSGRTSVKQRAGTLCKTDGNASLPDIPIPLRHAVHASLLTKYGVSHRTQDRHLWGRRGLVVEGPAQTNCEGFRRTYAHFQQSATEQFTEVFYMHSFIRRLWDNIQSAHVLLWIGHVDIEISSAKRAKLFMDQLFGCLFMCTLAFGIFDDGLSHPLNPPDCPVSSFSSGLYIFFAIAVASISALLNQLWVFVFQRTFQFVESPDKVPSVLTNMKMFDAIFWIFSFGCTAMHLIFIFGFIGNLSERDEGKWTFTVVIVLIYLLLIAPIIYALFWVIWAQMTINQHKTRSMKDMAAMMDLDLTELTDSHSHILKGDDRPNTQENQDAEWKAKVVDLAHRGITTAHVLNLYERLGKDVMMHFDSQLAQTHDVVRQAIIPLSRQDHFLAPSRSFRLRIQQATFQNLEEADGADIRLTTMVHIPGNEDATPILTAPTSIQNPQWNQESLIPLVVFGETLQFNIYRHEGELQLQNGRPSITPFVQATMMNSTFYKHAFNGQLMLRDNSGEERGHLNVQLEPFSAEPAGAGIQVVAEVPRAPAPVPATSPQGDGTIDDAIAEVRARVLASGGADDDFGEPNSGGRTSPAGDLDAIAEAAIADCRARNLGGGGNPANADQLQDFRSWMEANGWRNAARRSRRSFGQGAGQAQPPIAMSTDFQERQLPNAMAYATVVADGNPVIADKMVIHWWGGKFVDLIAAIISDALNYKTCEEVSTMLHNRKIDALRAQLSESKRLTFRYWCDAFSVNQHTSISSISPPNDSQGYPITPCESSVAKHFDGPHCEVNKFHDMIAYLKKMVRERSRLHGVHQRFGAVISCDRELRFLSRVWCLAEAVEASNLSVPQTLRFHSAQTLQGALQQIDSVNVDDARASFAADKSTLLENITDRSAFNSKAKKTMLKRISDQFL